jgi:small subunit ribosomal protein S1
VELDQQIKVVTLDFDENKTRIQLGLKQLTEHPWESLDENLKIGDKVTANGVVLADYGAFVEIMPGVEALIHVSEMSWSTHLRSAQDFLTLGQEVEAQVLTLDREERKMSLGIKQLYPDPWVKIAEKYPIESKHKGIVKNFTNFGIFIELEEGVDGLIHISDLSWTQKIKHPADFTKIGDKLDVVVLELDGENRRLSLGHKQLQDNPWDVYETIFIEDSIHEGEVVSVFEKGATVIFKKEGLEGYIPKRYCIKSDKTKLEVGEIAEFKVLEFSKDNRRIIVCLKDNIVDFEHEEKQNKKQQELTKNKVMKDVQSKISKSTLGDLDVLSDLKNKIDDQ